MKKLLYLHIGTHKTGSTSIQYLLNKYELFLNELGIFIPKTGRIYDGHHNIAWELTNDERFSETHGTLSDLIRELRTSHYDIVILSSEDFEYLNAYPEKMQYFFGLLSEEGYNINVIAFFREQTEYASDLYTELLTHKIKISPEEFISEIVNNGAFKIKNWYFEFNYQRFEKNIKKALDNKGKFIKLRYVKDVWPVFLKILGIDPLTFHSAFQNEKLNAFSFAEKFNLQYDIPFCCTPCDFNSIIKSLNFNKILEFIPERLTDVNPWHGHIPFAFWIVSILKPRLFVELGTHKGDSYCAFVQAVAELGLDTKCYAVDTWKGDKHAGFYDEQVFKELKEYHNKRYKNFSCLIRDTFDNALNLFEEGNIDLLHIDGEHTYNVVKHDFFNWLPKMSEKGVILLHDTNVFTRDFGVWKLMKELKERFPYFEFFHSYGLGVIEVGKDIPKGLDRLFKAKPEERVFIRELFFERAQKILTQKEKKYPISLEKELTPKDYYNKAIALYNNGQEEEAIKLYKKVVESDPNFALAHNDLAVIYWQKSLYHLKKAITLAPNNKNVIWNYRQIIRKQ